MCHGLGRLRLGGVGWGGVEWGGVGEGGAVEHDIGTQFEFAYVPSGRARFIQGDRAYLSDLALARVHCFIAGT